MHEGPPGHIHGGIVAALLDEAMSKLNRPLNVLAMTRHMEIDYLRPAPLYQPLVLIGRHLTPADGNPAASSSIRPKSSTPTAPSSPAAKASSSPSTNKPIAQPPSPPHRIHVTILSQLTD